VCVESAVDWPLFVFTARSEGAEEGKAAEPVCSLVFRDISQKTSSSTKLLMKTFVLYIGIEELGEWHEIIH
jgi:hypothetical protein